MTRSSLATHFRTSDDDDLVLRLCPAREAASLCCMTHRNGRSLGGAPVTSSLKSRGQACFALTTPSVFVYCCNTPWTANAMLVTILIFALRGKIRRRLRLYRIRSSLTVFFFTKHQPASNGSEPSTFCLRNVYWIGASWHRPVKQR